MQQNESQYSPEKTPEQLTESTIMEESVNEQAQPTQDTKSYWAQRTPGQLRYALYRKRALNQDIPQELSAELKKYFPDYDEKTHTFSTGGTRRTKPSEHSEGYLVQQYYKLRAKNEEISDELNDALAQKFPLYDPETRTFKRKARTQAKQSTAQNPQKPLSEYGDAWIRKQMYKYKHSDTPIPQELNNELYRRFGDRYNPETLTVRRRPKYETVKPANYYVPDQQADCCIDFSNMSRNELIQIFKSYRIRDIRFTPQLKKALKQHFDNYDPVSNSFITQNTYLSRTDIKPKAGVFNIQILPQPKDKDLGLYSVTINNKPLLTDQQNVSVKVFANGTLLGVYGTDVYNHDIPNKPVWRLYDARLNQITQKTVYKFNPYDIYIENVSEHANMVYIKFSEGLLRLIDTKKLQNIANGIQFKIINQRTK